VIRETLEPPSGVFDLRFVDDSSGDQS
jgi:hypothetical protein